VVPVPWAGAAGVVGAGVAGLADGADGLVGLGAPPGDPVASTTAVAADGAELAPAPLRAVTTTTIVWPASARVSVYSRPSAPSMSTQFVPSVSHRCHWYVWEIGDVPSQPPSPAVNVLPWRAVPVMTGGAELLGACGVPPAGATVADGPEVWSPVPPGPRAVTATRSVFPSSAATTA
jgi:hypothetical protein